MSDQKVILVTGATSGIGEASAKALAAAGYAVVLTGRRADKGLAVAEAITAAGGKAEFVQGNVTDRAHIEAAVAIAKEKFGGLHGAFNNAGIEGDLFTPTHEQTRENFDNIMNINVFGVLNAMSVEVPAILESGGGSIVNNASIAGLVGFPGMSVYVASKHAVVGLTRNAALEYGKSGVRVNAVCPGPIETEMYDRFANDEVREMIAAMNPQGRPGTAAEIASAVVWLLDPANTYTNGVALPVDGAHVAG